MIGPQLVAAAIFGIVAVVANRFGNRFLALAGPAPADATYEDAQQTQRRVLRSLGPFILVWCLFLFVFRDRPFAGTAYSMPLMQVFTLRRFKRFEQEHSVEVWQRMTSVWTPRTGNPFYLQQRR